MVPSVSDMSAPWATPNQELSGTYVGLAGTNILELVAHDMQMLCAPPPVSEASGGLSNAFESVNGAASSSEAHEPVDVLLSSSGEAAGCTDVTPPVTPRRDGAGSSGSPPRAPQENPLPPLLGALCMNSLERVSEVLETDPEAAAIPFWEHGVCPPLCSAVRHGCNASIVRLLLEKRADPDMANSRGQTPLSILASTPSTGIGCKRELWVQGTPQRLGNRSLPPSPDCLATTSSFEEQAEKLLGWSLRERGSEQRNTLAVAEALAAAGADLAQPDPAGNVPLDLATAAGNDQLVRFWCRLAPELATVTEDGSGEEAQHTCNAQMETSLRHGS